IHKAIDYLCTGRKGSGSFGATQATILALKALTAHAGATQQVKDGEIRVFSGEKEVARQAFTHRQAGPTMIDLTAEVMGALGGEREIHLKITGGGKLPWTFDLSYHADQPADDDDCQVAIETFLSKRHVEEGGTVALTLRVDNLQKDKPLPMTMAIVGLPAGLHVSKDVLDDLKKAEQFGLPLLHAGPETLGPAPEDHGAAGALARRTGAVRHRGRSGSGPGRTPGRTPCQATVSHRCTQRTHDSQKSYPCRKKANRKTLRGIRLGAAGVG
ncbi:MAG: hypothetical protein ACYST0_13530, partial [Planctomycetota bacterium]